MDTKCLKAKLLVILLLSKICSSAQNISLDIQCSNNSCYKKQKIGDTIIVTKELAIYDSLLFLYNKDLNGIRLEFLKTNISDTRANFYSYVRTYYPYLYGLIQSIVPALHFDFYSDEKNYVLRKIEIAFLKVQVRTTKRETDETWYDIILKPNKSKKQIIEDINKKLYFNGRGSSEFYFFAEHGNYSFVMTFFFIVNGKYNCKISTAPININF